MKKFDQMVLFGMDQATFDKITAMARANRLTVGEVLQDAIKHIGSVVALVQPDRSNYDSADQPASIRQISSDAVVQSEANRDYWKKFEATGYLPSITDGKSSGVN